MSIPATDVEYTPTQLAKHTHVPIKDIRIAIAEGALPAQAKVWSDGRTSYLVRLEDFREWRKRMREDGATQGGRKPVARPVTWTTINYNEL